ncbi:tetratricopeptide repeat-containing sensor histidine kinase [Flavihumibacter solisilvae]|uniref:Signal transduction histidine kinase internal region domain-containing protein n=1 Tax=Flavihumibacter solisilvae TaxID=1349421 RepID=A0A0C1IJK0_9BACT|nr:histidine kinase [Flavihumibacter solisilvae]KIC94365.1 hypothetical protein OI18_12140 [Flavihumibacter solisilvae]
MKLTFVIFILSIHCLQCGPCLGQKKQIDSLVEVLNTLSDTSRVDCLNELARLHIVTSHKSHGKPDTAWHYLDQAASEAIRIKYFRGIALTMQRRAWIERILLSNFPKAEEYGKQSLYWYTKTPNKEGLCYSLVETGQVIFSQSRYDEAIRFLLESFECFRKENDQAMIWPLSLTGQVYREKGEYNNAFDVFRQCLQIASNTGNERRVTQELLNIGHLYSTIESYETALLYYRKAFDRMPPKERSVFDIVNYAGALTKLKDFDSALIYYHTIDTDEIKQLNPQNLRFYLAGVGEYFLARHMYDSAQEYLSRGLTMNLGTKDHNQVKRLLLDLARNDLSTGNYKLALKNTHEGLRIAKETRSKQYIRDAYQVLYETFDRLGKEDSAYQYFKSYTMMKDTVLSDQVKGKFAAFEFEQQIEQLEKDRKLQQAKLEKMAIVRTFIIGGSIILLVLGIFVIFSINLQKKNETHRRIIAENELGMKSLESERRQAELKRHAAELEMQALRAQMNPHFIFNSLNSINRFILQNDRQQASEYLAKFSRLVRMILQNSQSPLITLEDELEALSLYLDLECLRFAQHFDYKITLHDDLEADVVKIPPLVIQPYVENAIWHGLTHKNEKGHLDIIISAEEDHLLVKILDDGVGRRRATELTAALPAQHKSMGLKITANRIALLKESNTGVPPVTIIDLVHPGGEPAGTEVNLRLPLIEN